MEPILQEELKGLPKQLEEYADTYLKLLSAKLAQKYVNAGAGIVSGLMFYVPLLFAFLFAAAALAWWVGDMLHNHALGFLLVSALFLIIAMVVILSSRKMIVPRLKDKFVRDMYR
jgi:hypothetical protein